MQTVALAIVVYAVSLLGHAILNKVEFARTPEKRTRYRALPIKYKLMCWFVVLPIFTASIVVPIVAEGWWLKALGYAIFFLGGLGAFLFLDGACRRWYREQGMW